MEFRVGDFDRIVEVDPFSVWWRRGLILELELTMPLSRVRMLLALTGHKLVP